ncbi:unnamed protein product [Arabidopsis lyrata]|uniref:RING-type E3 ubiquitin transferase n=1 Tax=Arabidopsis lyrata subsp. lyrata TaxID=81972 RepID=D7M946_ARALL|nr:E3 ubiquitin-protein ligase RNF126 [Arabidopsis lyrata subsp. lyrata]EFH43967.1 zinc finger family protein [Arabidopsis lyrata subsp. lyrata]CAH8275611.1 unnamed protein product [Arabidopsis lyrata]|eukprot:XP_002867708.1 E3 ubiquitin-protein ligase RNF126 [Arabidopsis lyrata subsp. lyrata]
MGCCCCLPSIPESSRTIDEHVPLSRAPPSSLSNAYTSPLSPPIPLAFTNRNLQTSPPKLPRTQSNSSEASPGLTQVVPEKEKWHVDDITDFELKKQYREAIDECPICLEEYEIENPKLLTKCGHDFHLACILEWMERSEACPVCDKEIAITESQS